MTQYGVDSSAIREAQRRIAPFAHRTPVMTSRAINNLANKELFFKCEHLQKVGAFKFRGACNAVMQLPADVAARGVVTHSSGNHAQALALAASIRGIPAHIVMPANAAAVKRRAVEGYGAKVYPCDPTLEAREMTAARVVQTEGGTLIPPYDHPDVIAGQGTVALELLEQVEGLDAIVAPIGGGGLVSGICIAVSDSLATGQPAPPRILAAEPAGADDAARSLAAGKLIPQSNPQTIADGLLTSLGRYTWPIVRDHVERVITVTDQQIVSAMRLIAVRMKQLIEPSAAVAVAAVLTEEFGSLGGIVLVGIVISGGNVDLDHRYG